MPTSQEIARGTARTALVADDDPAFRLLIEAALVRLGFQVTMARDGLAAMERALEHTFDLVVLDVLMPGADGFEVCRALRGLPAYRHSPILMLTGLEDHTSVARAFEAGASDFERKPVHVNLLSHRLLFLTKAADDLRELEQKRAELEYRATHDTLTGLANRAGLAARLDRVVADRSNGRCAAVLYVDLDGFKAINDAFGHPFGDRLLCRIVDRIGSVVPARYLTARVGGDEFVVVVDGLEDAAPAEAIARTILAALEEPLQFDDHEFVVGASIGMCTFPQHGSSADELLRNADLAMYRAKELGRGRFHTYDEKLSLEALERSALQADLRRALHNGELELLFQPLFDLSTGRIEAAEALLRWNHPSRGLLGPNAFIPLADDAGLLPEIGRAVLERAAGLAARWCRPPFGLGHVSVNLSGTEIRRGNLAGQLRAIVERAGIEPGMLQIEVSEALTADLAGEPGGLDALRALSAIGLTLAVDDFGTGKSSIPQLEKLPVSTLKVDVSLVRALTENSRDQAVIRAIVALGRCLGLTLVAEGIESREQMAWLHEAGCALGQGYAFAEPLGAEPFEALLTTRQGGDDAALAARIPTTDEPAGLRA